MDRKQELERLLQQFGQLGIDRQIDYNKFYLYSIITHSTAIEGSTVTEIENQMLFDHGISAGGHTLIEQYMNLDLKAAYERCMELVINKGRWSLNDCTVRRHIKEGLVFPIR